MATPSTSSSSSPPATSVDLIFFLVPADASKPIRSFAKLRELVRKVLLEDTVQALIQQIEKDYNAEPGTAFLWKARDYLLVDALYRKVREKPVYMFDFCDSVDPHERIISILQPSESDDLTFIITYVPRAQQVSQVPATQADSEKTEHYHYLEMVKNFATLCLAARDLPTPSSACKPSSYLTNQRSEYALLDGREGGHPSDRSTMANPIELYHPAFALFRSIVEDSESKVPDDLVRETAKLRRHLSNVESEEDPRHDVIEASFPNLFQTPFRISVNADSPDLAALCPTGLIDEAALCVVDIKAELGDSGDPALRGSFQYRQFWLQEKPQSVHNAACPSFIVGVAGPWLVVLGAVFTDGVIVQRLSDYMWLGCSRVLDDRNMVITRTLYALRCALKALKTYYQDLEFTHEILNRQRFFPFVTLYIDPETKEEVKFNFVDKMQHDQTCVTFLAIRERDAQRIVVKFAARYGKQGKCTSIWRKKQLAPALLYCGPVVQGSGGFGDLRMVVMDYIDGQTLFRIYKGQDLPNSVFDKIQESLDILHDGGYVFGDLRRPNVMLMNGEGPLESRIRFIDFDWAGKEGEVRYPLNLSSRIEKVAKVMEWEIVQREHEDRLLEAMKGPHGP
ncbi:hypothetical protein NLI96_g9900 [Meripilus lineatus]|uniref:Protein kinase domain-containing protein n=1 Tax=Meripilus lineatus TaxID=2056292 RepID=A0AAD5UUS1_9APHY|nr:hypothetical protein NLI96_g9900 [Physisporinus lineatus]